MKDIELEKFYEELKPIIIKKFGMKIKRDRRKTMTSYEFELLMGTMLLSALLDFYTKKGAKRK